MTIYADIFKKFDVELAKLGPEAAEKLKAEPYKLEQWKPKWYENINFTLPTLGTATWEQVGQTLDRAWEKTVHSGILAAIGYYGGTRTLGMHDVAASKVGKFWAMRDLRRSFEEQNVKITDISTPEEPLWRLTDTYGNVRFLNPERELEGTVPKDAGEWIAELGGYPYTPEMRMVYDTANFVGTLKTLHKGIRSATKHIALAPRATRVLQNTVAGLMTDTLMQIEDIAAEKRKTFNFEQTLKTGGMFLAFGGVVEGWGAARDAISDAYFIRQFLKTPMGQEAIRIGATPAEMKWYLSAIRAAKSGTMAPDAWTRRYNSGGQLFKLTRTMQQAADNLGWRPPFSSLLPEKAGTSIDRSFSEIMKAEVSAAKAPEIMKAPIAMRAATTAMVAPEQIAITKPLDKIEAKEIDRMPPDQQKDIEYQKIETSKEIRAAAKTDPRIAKILAKNLYGGDIDKVIVKELVQNAHDALKAVTNASERFLHVNVDTTSREITVIDDGIGMSPEVMQNQFVDYGGSYKPEGSAGGFGLAKFAILGNSKEILVESTKRINNKYITTTLAGSGMDWADPSVGLKVDVKEGVRQTEGTMLKLKLYDPAEGGIEYFRDWTIHDYLSRFRDLSNIPYRLDLSINRAKLASLSDAKKETDLKLIEKNVVGPGFTANIYATEGLSASSLNWVEVPVLNQGLYQFEMDMSVPEVKLPKKIIIDIRSDLPPEHDNYPFDASRERLKHDAKEAMKQYINQKLVQQALDAKKQQYAAVFRDAPRVGHTFKYLVDASNKIDPSLLKKWADDPLTVSLVRTMQKGFSSIVGQLGNKLSGKLNFNGFVIARDYVGIHLKGNYIGKQANQIMLNLPGLWMDSGAAPNDYPEVLAGQMVATTMHEIAHQQSGGHHEQYAGVLTRFVGSTIAEQMKTARALANVLRSHSFEELERMFHEQHTVAVRKDLLGDIASGQSIEVPAEGEGAGMGKAGGKAGAGYGEVAKASLASKEQNPYLRVGEEGMTLDRVREDAKLGVTLAEEALARLSPEEFYGKEAISPISPNQTKMINRMVARHQLTQEGIVRLLQYATGESNIESLSMDQARTFIEHLRDLDTLAGATEVLSKGHSVAVDMNLPRGAMADIRRIAQSDEVFNNTMLYSQRLGGGPKNDNVPDVEGRRKLYAEDLKNAAAVRRRFTKKVAGAEAKGREFNALNHWSSVRYALGQAELKTGIPLRRMFSNIVADAVDVRNKNVDANEQAIRNAGLSTIGAPVTFEESKQIAKWLFEEDEYMSNYYWTQMSPDAKKLAAEAQKILQGRSANLIRWARFIKWDRAVKTADLKMARLREKGTKITKERLKKIMEPVRKSRPPNAPMEALQQGRDARDIGQFQDWLATQTWGTRKHYYMTERELKDLVDLLPEGSIPEELEQQMTQLGGMPEQLLPETMTREGAGKIAKGGNIMSAILNHMNRVGTFAATHDDLVRFWEAFASSNPSRDDISAVRSLLGNALGMHHATEKPIRWGRGLSRLFWRFYFLSPKRSLWFSTRNLHQNLAYGLSQIGVSEAAVAASEVAAAVSRGDKIGANPWIIDDFDQYWTSRISQRKQMQHQFILQKQGDIVNDFGNKATGVIDYLGHFPMYSDEINRFLVWPVMHQAAYRNIQMFMEGKLSAKKLWSNLDIDTLHTSQRLELNRLLDEENLRQFVANYAEYKTENIHFRYETTLRSIAEQRPGGRLAMGLYTFPKGTFEIMYQNGVKPFLQGIDSGNYQQSYKGFKAILMGFLGSRAARYLLAYLTGRTAYGIVDTVFRYTPLPPGASNVREMGDRVSEALWLADENNTPLDKTAESILAVGVNQLELFIPLCDVLVDYYEVNEDVYGVRLFSLAKNKALKVFKDETGKDYRAADRTNLEKLRHMLFGGAEKGKAVKERPSSFRQFKSPFTEGESIYNR